MLDISSTSAGRTAASDGGLCVLVVDDDEAVRRIYVALLRKIDGLGTVLAADDGTGAVRLAKSVALDIALLDLNMPRLNGVDAAVQLATLQPGIAIALHSSDPDQLRHCAAGLGFSLFDKLEFDDVVAWVADEVASYRAAARGERRDLVCSRCGYGIVGERPPARCPICDDTTRFVECHSRAAGY